MVTNDRSKSDTVPVVEAAKRLGISRNSAYQAVATGELKAIRIGHRLLVPRAILDKMLGVEA